MTKQKNFRLDEETNKQLEVITRIANERQKATFLKLGIKTKSEVSQAVLISLLIEAEFNKLKEEGYDVDSL